MESFLVRSCGKEKLLSLLLNVTTPIPVQVASCTNQMGQIAIVAMQNSSPKVTECFNVESRILCMAYVPMEQRTQENGEGNPENNHSSAGKTSDAPTVCLGMEEGRYVWVYIHKPNYKLTVSLHLVFTSTAIRRYQNKSTDVMI